MPRHLPICMCVIALAMSACADTDRTGVSAASEPVAAQASAVSPGDAPMHGDHNPHHGGTVYMQGDMHYEVVLDSGGHHSVYFSDSARADLPASVAEMVTLTVERPGGASEQLTGVIDPHGERWTLDGAPVTTPDTNVRVTFATKGEKYWIDVPFIARQP